jgi:hypothetical protein
MRQIVPTYRMMATTPQVIGHLRSSHFHPIPTTIHIRNPMHATWKNSWHKKGCCGADDGQYPIQRIRQSLDATKLLIGRTDQQRLVWSTHLCQRTQGVTIGLMEQADHLITQLAVSKLTFAVHQLFVDGYDLGFYRLRFRHRLHGLDRRSFWEGITASILASVDVTYRWRDLG